jgi:hypothetical protein
MRQIMRKLVQKNAVSGSFFSNLLQKMPETAFFPNETAFFFPINFK